MDYEKKYNEALKWMRELYPGLHGATKEDAEHYFPELLESEDERIRKELVNFLRSPFIKENLTDEKVAPWLAYLEKQKEQKPAEWNEEDNLMLTAVIQTLENFGPYGTIGMQIDWLKSLRPQPKQEWSEEDKKHIKLILRVLDIQQCWDGATGKKYNPYQDEIDWLKSLRPSWKPSEEQMEELNKVRTLNPGLDALYQQLKNM